MQLKNPWSHLRWKGNFSEFDKENWTSQLQKELNFDPTNAQQFDNGNFVQVEYEIGELIDCFLRATINLLLTFCKEIEWIVVYPPHKKKLKKTVTNKFMIDNTCSVLSDLKSAFQRRVKF